MFGIWWEGNGYGTWYIGHDSNKGLSEKYIGCFVEDVLCPHQISENGELWYGKKLGWRDVGKSLCIRAISLSNGTFFGDFSL